jgi:hypothetical protein
MVGGDGSRTGSRRARCTQLALDRQKDVHVEYDQVLTAFGYACTDLSSSTARPRQKAR